MHMCALMFCIPRATCADAVWFLFPSTLTCQVQEYKSEIERLTRELADFKKKYYEKKRKEQMSKDSTRGMVLSVARYLHTSAVRLA